MGYNNNNNNNNKKVNLFTNNNNINNTNNNIVMVRTVEATARKLVEKFNAPSSFLFYCSIAWKLPEAYIWRNYEMSRNAKNPGALFNFLCRKDIELRK